ncbi:MAG: InsA N-terminal domain [Dehalococcoidia bacterium]|nr:InsA N-terminal domain [Dehalococcoidia bacterium]
MVTEQQVVCKYCLSPNVSKFGTHNGIQRYWCKDEVLSIGV